MFKIIIFLIISAVLLSTVIVALSKFIESTKHDTKDSADSNNLNNEHSYEPEHESESDSDSNMTEMDEFRKIFNKEYKKSIDYSFNPSKYLDSVKACKNTSPDFDPWDVIMWRKILFNESKYFVVLYKIFRNLEAREYEIIKKIKELDEKIKNSLHSQENDENLSAYINAKKDIETNSNLDKIQRELETMVDKLYCIAYNICAAECRVGAHVPDNDYTAFTIYITTEKTIKKFPKSRLVRFVAEFAHLEKIKDRRDIFEKEYDRIK